MKTTVKKIAFLTLSTVFLMLSIITDTDAMESLSISSLSGSYLTDPVNGWNYSFNPIIYKNDTYKTYPALNFSNFDTVYTGSVLLPGPNGYGSWNTADVMDSYKMGEPGNCGDTFSCRWNLNGAGWWYSGVAVPVTIKTNGVVEINGRTFCPYKSAWSYSAWFNRYAIWLLPKNNLSQYGCPSTFSTDGVLVSFNWYDPSKGEEIAPAVKTFQNADMTCQTHSYPDTANIEWLNFFDIPDTLSTRTENFYDWKATRYQTNSENGAVDKFVWMNFDTGSNLKLGTLQESASDETSVFVNHIGAGLDGNDTITSKIVFNSTRENTIQNWNVVSFRTETEHGLVGSYASTRSNWKYASNQEKTLVYSSGGKSTVVEVDGNYWIVGNLIQLAPLDKIKLGKAPWIQKTYCTGNNGNGCHWDIFDTDKGYECIGDDSGGFETGVCGVDSNGYCAPLRYATGSTAGSIRTPNVLPWQTALMDGSGNLVSTWYFQAKKLEDDDIFSCIDPSTGETYSGFSVFLCPVSIVSKTWGKMKKLGSDLLDMVGNFSSVGNVKGVWKMTWFEFFPKAYAEDYMQNVPNLLFHTTTGAVAPDQGGNSFSGKDVAGVNKAIYSAGDGLKNMDGGGIKGLFTFMYYSLIAIFVFIATVWILSSIF